MRSEKQVVHGFSDGGLGGVTMKTRAVLLLVAMLVPGLVHAGEQAELETITIRGSTYSIVPDEEMRALGFELPDVAPDENAASDYLKAIEAYWPKDRREPLLDLRDKVIEDGWTAESAPLAEYFEQNEKTLEWLRAAASKDVCHFPVLVPEGSSLDETGPADILLPYLMYFGELARFLVAVGNFHEFEGRTGDALDAYVLALRLGGHVAQDPILINGLVGLACDQIAMRPIEQCLIRHEIDDETLAKAHRHLAAIAGGRPSLLVSLRGERALSTSMVEHLIEHPAWLREYAEALGASEHVRGELWQAAVAMMLAMEEGREQIRTDVRVFWTAIDEALEMSLAEFIRTDAGEQPLKQARARKVPPNIMSVLGGRVFWGAYRLRAQRAVVDRARRRVRPGPVCRRARHLHSNARRAQAAHACRRDRPVLGRAAPLPARGRRRLHDLERRRGP